MKRNPYIYMQNLVIQCSHLGICNDRVKKVQSLDH